MDANDLSCCRSHRDTRHLILACLLAAALAVGCGDSGSAGAGALGEGNTADASDGQGAGDVAGPGDLDSAGPDGAGPDGAGMAGTGEDGAGTDAETAPLPPTEPGCGESVLLERPADPEARGPWPVGARTVSVAGLTVEVWYPASLGADIGLDVKVYDIRPTLPPSQVGLIPDEDNPWMPCDCVSELPLDTDHGPYPVVVFVHGTASFRMQSLTQMTHWASRGFVVVAADHPGLKLADILALACPDDEPSGARDLGADVDALLAALAAPEGDLGFLAGAIDPDRVGLAGHSAGGAATAELADRPGVRVAIPMSASQPIATASSVELALFLGGALDAIVEPAGTIKAFEDSLGFDRQIGILEGAVHLTFSDICRLRNAADEDLLTIAAAHGVCGFEFASVLVDCDQATLDHTRGGTIVNHLSTLALEQVLHCADTSAAVVGLPGAIPELVDWRVEPAGD